MSAIRTSHLIALLAVLVAALVTSGVTSAASKPSILFSITAPNAEITGTKGNMRVSIPADSMLAWFNDRPGRTAGTTTAASLAAAWDLQRFDTDPPNAALVTTRKGTTMQTIVTLTDPRVKKGRVSFRYRVLADAKMNGMSTTGRPALGSYERTSLFVDNGLMLFCPATFDGATTVGTTPGTGYLCIMPANTPFAVNGHSPWLNVQACHPSNSTGGGSQTQSGIQYGYVHWNNDLWQYNQWYNGYDYGTVGPLPVCNSSNSAWGQIARQYAASTGSEIDNLSFSSTDTLTVMSVYRIN